jgi:TonB family protein
MKTTPTFSLPLLVLAASLTPGELLSQQEIPIEVRGPRVLVPTRVNGSPPLDLILDTGMGMRGGFLFRREHSEWLDTTPNVLVQIPGVGGGEASTARGVDAQTLTAGPVVLDSPTIFVSQSDRTQDWSFDGIIGRSLLVDYTVELDYDRSVMRLHDRDWHPEGPEWTRVPVRIERGLPWFEAEVEAEEGVIHPTQVYIDLASASTLELLVGSNRPFNPPSGAEEVELGVGLSGEIRGWCGQTPRLRVAGYDLLEVSTNWAPAEIRSKGGAAGGILGNGFMRYFNVVFQYAEGALYLRPSQRYVEAYFEQAQTRASREPSQTKGNAAEPEKGQGSKDSTGPATEAEAEGRGSAAAHWQDIAEKPVPVRYSVSPELKNWAESLRLTVEQHPPALRDAGIGGTVHLWILVDREGIVRKAVPHQGSGHEALDQAALRLAVHLRFYPALDGATPVPAWFAVPFHFPTRIPAPATEVDTSSRRGDSISPWTKAVTAVG